MKRTFLFIVSLGLSALLLEAQETRYIRLDPSQLQEHVVGGVQKAKADCLFAVSKQEHYLDKTVNITLAFGVEDTASNTCKASMRFGTTNVVIAQRQTQAGSQLAETVIASPESISGVAVPIVLTPQQEIAVLAWMEAGKGQYLEGLAGIGAIKGAYVTPTEKQLSLIERFEAATAPPPE